MNEVFQRHISLAGGAAYSLDCILQRVMATSDFDHSGNKIALEKRYSKIFKHDVDHINVTFQGIEESAKTTSPDIWPI